MSNKWLVIIGTVLGLITVILINFHINRIEAEQQGLALLRLKANTSLAKTQKLKPEMLDTEQIPERFQALTARVIPDTQENRAWLAERPAIRDIAAGAPLLYEYFVDEPSERFGARITPGKRAIALPVTGTTAVSYFVEPESRVDILGTFERRDEQTLNVPVPAADGKKAENLSILGVRSTTQTRTLLQNIRVLAVGQAVTRGSYLGLNAQGFDTVTVEVTPEEAEKLTFALGEVRQGLTLVLRNPEDAKPLSLLPMGWDSLR